MMVFGEVVVVFWGVVLLRRLILCACSRGTSWLCGEFEAKVLHLCEY